MTALCCRPLQCNGWAAKLASGMGLRRPLCHMYESCDVSETAFMAPARGQRPSVSKTLAICPSLARIAEAAYTAAGAVARLCVFLYK